MIASIEYPRLDPEPYLAQLDGMGAAAADVDRSRTSRRRAIRPRSSCVRALNAYLFEEQGFVGQPRALRGPAQQLPERSARSPHRHSDHAVAGLHGSRRGAPACRSTASTSPATSWCAARTSADAPASGLIIDPFHGGALLSEHDCRVLLQKHVGTEIAFSKSLLAPATRKQIIVRMLLNLKRIYVHMRSFPQARDVTELLLALTPSALSELRDRGLLAYHLNDVTGALRDLQTYLKLVEHERDGQGSARGARPDLGARQDAAPPRRGAQLEALLKTVHHTILNEIGVDRPHPLCGDVRRHLRPVMSAVMAQMHQNVGYR